jgi:hypothetical protein
MRASDSAKIFGMSLCACAAFIIATSKHRFDHNEHSKKGLVIGVTATRTGIVSNRFFAEGA